MCVYVCSYLCFCVCAYVRVYMCVNIYSYTATFKHTHTHTHTHIHAHTYSHTNTHTHTHAHTRTRTHTRSHTHRVESALIRVAVPIHSTQMNLHTQCGSIATTLASSKVELQLWARTPAQSSDSVRSSLSRNAAVVHVFVNP